MKKKIISLLLCTTLVVGACGKYSHAHEEKHIAPKSAIAISGATATAILTLATYAGIQFHDSETFDEFLRRMCGLEQSVDFLVAVTSLVGKSVHGTIEFTQELITDFKDMLNRIALTKNIKYKADSNGYQLPILNDVGTSYESRQAFLKAFPGVQSSPSGNVEKTINYGESFIYVHSLSHGYRARCNSTDVSAGGCFWTTRYNEPSDTRGNKTIIGLYEDITYVGSSEVKKYYFAHISADTNASGTSYGWPDFSFCKTSSHQIKFEQSYEKKLNMSVGSSWASGKGEITSNNDSGGVTLKIPSSMDSLLDKSPGDVSTPTYDTWNPGKDVSIPSIDNPAIDYTPDTSTDNPGDTDTDNPGDTDTDNPGDTGTQNPGIPDFGPITVPNIDLTPLQLSISSITEKFPFSLPWDIKRIGETFKGNSSVNAPVIEFEFNNHNVKLDFNRFNSIAMIIRGFVYVEFAIGLIYVIRKLKP